MAQSNKIKFRKLYRNSEKYRCGRIRHAKEYNDTHRYQYKQYQRIYRMKKRIEAALYGFVCEAKMQKAVNAMFGVIEHEIELDREYRKKLV